MEDLGFHERWLVVDALLRRPRPDLGDWSVQYCSKQRPTTYVRGTGDRRRWEIAVLPDEDECTITQRAKVLELLKPWVTPEEIDLERAALYTFHSAIAPHWRSGRLLIAGDAAHLTPPFLGQGLCAGMRDAGNLAWKLARVLRGQNHDSLLDTYQSERAPHVREYIELAVRLGGLINTKAMQAAVPGSVLDGGEAAQMTSIKPRLGSRTCRWLERAIRRHCPPTYAYGRYPAGRSRRVTVSPRCCNRTSLRVYRRKRSSTLRAVRSSSWTTTRPNSRRGCKRSMLRPFWCARIATCSARPAPHRSCTRSPLRSEYLLIRKNIGAFHETCFFRYGKRPRIRRW